MAVGFAVVGFFFIAWPDGTLDVHHRVRRQLRRLHPAPETDERLWLALGFAYMVVITGICAGRRRRTSSATGRMLLVLAAGKAASSLTSLVFYSSRTTSSSTC